MPKGEAKKTFAEKIKSMGKKRLAVTGGIAIVAAVALIFLVSLVLKVGAYDKIYPNVTAGGVAIGKATTEEAIEKLKAEFDGRIADKEFTLVLEGSEIKFKAKDIDAAADIEKTVQNAYDYGKKGNIFTKIGKYMNGTPYELQIEAEINEQKAEALIAQLAGGKETPVRETEFSILGDVLTITNGHGGIGVDREKAYGEIKKSIFSLSEENIELKLERAEPKKVDLDTFYKKITEGQKNAGYAREDGNIVVTEGFPKIEMSKEELKAALDSGEESYEIKVKVTPPDVTEEELKAKLFRDKMGSWTSRYSESNTARSSNVKISASRINGVMLLPGETFSYDQTIGRRTAANGYKTAAVYVGNKVDEGIGGGICQTSSTLYSAVLYSNLEIVSRTSHSLPVSYMPDGQDATIAEGYIDFKFKNNTDYPIKIVCTAGGGAVTCSILGVKPAGQTVTLVNTRTSTLQPKVTRTTNPDIPVGYKKITQEGAIGYTVSSQRIVSVNGVEEKRENLTKSVYKAQDIIEEVNPADENTPSESLVIFDENAVKEPAVPTVTPEVPVSTPEAPSRTPEETMPENQPEAAPEPPAESSEEESGDLTVVEIE